VTVTAISPVAAQELLLKNARERMDILAAYREAAATGCCGDLRHDA
jgi:hypothetical protein